MLNVGSYAAAERLAGRIGLLRTMVYTHLPSSVILLCLPLVGTPWQAIVIFLLRESLVQMDVPTRQSYVALVTRPGERTLAMGVTNLTRNVGWALGPSAGGAAMATFGLGAPLVIGASLKIAYDLLLFAAYRRVPEEGQRDRGTD
jgi:predicted MFS family arabinose efflux permease